MGDDAGGEGAPDPVRHPQGLCKCDGALAGDVLPPEPERRVRRGGIRLVGGPERAHRRPGHSRHQLSDPGRADRPRAIRADRAGGTDDHLHGKERLPDAGCPVHPGKDQRADSGMGLQPDPLYRRLGTHGAHRRSSQTGRRQLCKSRLYIESGEQPYGGRADTAL